MRTDIISFVGGGRITFILVSRLLKSGYDVKQIHIVDPNPQAQYKLKKLAPEKIYVSGDIENLVSTDLLFLALHPHDFRSMTTMHKLAEKSFAMIISCMPVVPVAEIKERWGRDILVVRTIPNAPSIIGEGFNPLYFPNNISNRQKKQLHNLFAIWGQHPEVAEDELEAYAVISGMGPTYFWFQWLKLVELATQFGIPEQVSRSAVHAVVRGANDLLLNSEYSPGDVLDLIPAYPLKKSENVIRELFEGKLGTLFNKLKSM